MEIKDITKQEDDFAKWYTDVCLKAELVDYSNVKGSMIIRPLGYAIWEEITKVLDQMFKETNHENVQMPMFIPESLLNIEKNHVEGFAPEVAWVTEGGNEHLEERICIRPTSETLFCDHFKKIIHSYRDLPILYNQWCTIVRWEKTTRPFLRSREILWQEGHTMHATEKEAREETLRMFNIYKKFQEDYLAIPVITGRKTDKEKFAGAVETWTVEAMMKDGYALQNGTSHYFGQNFAKAFGIEFVDKDNKLVTPYQTSWGSTTRMIGGLIMTHGDNHGLVLPPKIAPFKVIIIPIGEVSEVTNKIKDMLKNAKITFKCDESNKTPGFKFALSEVKGYPIRIEIGKKDLENNQVTIVRRDTLNKTKVDINNLIDKIYETMDIMQKEMFLNAKKRRDSMIYNINSYEELKNVSNEKSGFYLINWCGNVDCEDKIKDDLGLKSRCIIEECDKEKCVVCNKQSKYKLYVGRQY